MARTSLLLFPAACLMLVMAMTPTHSSAQLDQDNSIIAETSVQADVDKSVAVLADSASEIEQPETTGQPAAEAWQRRIPPRILLTGYCLLIVAASLFGGWLPSLVRLTHTRLQTIVSFVGGLMLGIAVFHLIPHAQHQLRDMDTTMLWLICGILIMFFLIRTFHFHNHGIAEEAQGHACDPCGVDHAHSHSHAHSHPGVHHLSWVGIVVGLSIHTLFDGIALGSVCLKSDSLGLLPGIGVFLAVLLHKPLDAVSITTLMSAGGWDKRHVQSVNAGFAMMCPLGAALVLLGANRFPGLQQELAGAAMAFSAGVFLCIALSDLLPEMEFHSHHRLRLSLALGLGVATAWAIRFLEPAHNHVYSVLR
ncbi:MAG: ZIP family metal transporter [Planctomycetaceae bacterium]